jgi:hypothetical protein
MRKTPTDTKALRQKTQLRLDSMTGVYPKHTHGFGIWGNERVPMTVRVDKQLKIEFKKAATALFGSTCNPLECIMAGFVGSYKNQLLNGVYPTLTVDIGEIKIERNLRERRKLTRTRTETETMEIETERQVCGFRGCSNVAVAKGVFQGDREFPLCETHLAEARGNRHNWSCIEEI